MCFRRVLVVRGCFMMIVFWHDCSHITEHSCGPCLASLFLSAFIGGQLPFPTQSQTNFH
jgi:hypothetical protein